MNRIYLLFVIITFIGASAFSPAKKEKVHFIPTLHGYHKINPNYSYDSLRAIISRIHPDIIAVEIRPEDVKEDSSYLKKNYPYEMWIMKYWFPSAEITGFDWLGKDLEGKKIPAGYWKNQSPIKKLERALSADSAFSAKAEMCQAGSDERDSLMKITTLNGLMKSKSDHEKVIAYYQCIEKTLKGSKYEELPAFYAERNRIILENLDNLIKKNPKKTIVIITGDDHFQLFRDKIHH